MIEPSKKIYIAVPEMKGDEKEGFYWSAEPLETRNSISYILDEWIPVGKRLPIVDKEHWHKQQLYRVTYLADFFPELYPVQYITHVAKFEYCHNTEQFEWLTVRGDLFIDTWGKVIAWQPIPLDDLYIPPNPPAPPS
jgi:hypothetical protein